MSSSAQITSSGIRTPTLLRGAQLTAELPPNVVHCLGISLLAGRINVYFTQQATISSEESRKSRTSNVSYITKNLWLRVASHIQCRSINNTAKLLYLRCSGYIQVRGGTVEQLGRRLFGHGYCLVETPMCICQCLGMTYIEYSMAAINSKTYKSVQNRHILVCTFSTAS